MLPIWWLPEWVDGIIGKAPTLRTPLLFTSTLKVSTKSFHISAKFSLVGNPTNKHRPLVAGRTGHAASEMGAHKLARGKTD
jgi:hypothetical protein